MSRTEDLEIKNIEKEDIRENNKEVERDIALSKGTFRDEPRSAIAREEWENRSEQKDMNSKEREELALERSKDIVKSITENKDRIEEQGFGKPLLSDVQKYREEIMLDIRTEKDLIDFAKDRFSAESVSLLEELVSIKYNIETELPVLDTLREYSLYDRLEELEIEGKTAVKSQSIDADELRNNVREYVDKIGSSNIREGLEERIDIRDNPISKDVLNYNREREVYISESDRERSSETIYSREFSERFKEDRDLLEKWDIDRDSKGLERDRALMLEKAIEDINLSPIVENYLMDMDKEDLEKVLTDVNSRMDYEKFLDRAAEHTGTSNKDEARDELEKNYYEQMLSWTKDERTVGLAVPVDINKTERFEHVKFAAQRTEDLERRYLAFDQFEKDVLKDKADMDKDGRYILPNKTENFMSRIDDIDKTKAVAAIQLSMIDRDNEHSKDFIHKSIDSRIDRGNLENTKDLVKELTTDIRESRNHEKTYNTSLTNGSRVFFEKDEEIERSYNYFDEKKELTGVLKVEDVRDKDILHKGDLRDLVKVKESRDSAAGFEREVIKDDRISEKEKTELFIDKLSEQKTIVNRFSNKVIEIELTKNVGRESFGKEAEERAQKAFETIKFSSNQKLRDETKKMIENSRNSSDKEENKVAQCFDMKNEVSKAFIRGQLESLEKDIRFEIGDTRTDINQMLYLDGRDAKEVESDVRDMVMYRATKLPINKDDRLEILLTERDRSETVKDIEKSLGRNIGEDELKFQTYLASNRMQEIVSRTAYALRGEDKNKSERNINEFLVAKFDLEKNDREGKLLGNIADERYRTMLFESTMGTGGATERHPDTDNNFDFHNSSAMREYMINQVLEKNEDIINVIFGEFEPSLEKTMDEKLPEMMDYNNALYMASFGRHFMDEGIAIDARVINVVPERSGTAGFAERHVLERETIQGVFNGVDSYRELDNGNYTSRTMGEIPKEEAERLNGMFRQMFDYHNARELFENNMRPSDAIELVARGEVISDHLRYKGIERGEGPWNREIKSYLHNIDYLRDALEKNFERTVHNEGMLFMSPADERFADSNYKDLFKLNDRGELANPELKEHFVERSEELMSALYKQDFLAERDLKESLDDVNKGISDRRNPFEKERDRLKLEIQREETKINRIEALVNKEVAKTEDLKAYNEERISKLTERRDEELALVSRGPLSRLKEVSVNMKYNLQLREIKNDEKAYEEDLRNVIANTDRQINEHQVTIEQLEARVLELRGESVQELISERHAYAEEKYQELYESWSDKGRTFTTNDWKLDATLGRDYKSQADKIKLYEDVRQMYYFDNYDRLESRLENRIKAAELRVNQINAKYDSSFFRSEENAPDEIARSEELRIEEMSKAAQDINTSLSISLERAQELNIHDIEMPMDSSDYILYESALNEKFVEYLKTEIHQPEIFEEIYRSVGELRDYEAGRGELREGESVRDREKEIEGWVRRSSIQRRTPIENIKENLQERPSVTLRTAYESYNERMARYDALSELEMGSVGAGVWSDEYYSHLDDIRDEVYNDLYLESINYSEHVPEMTPEEREAWDEITYKADLEQAKLMEDYYREMAMDEERLNRKLEEESREEKLSRAEFLEMARSQDD